MATYIIYNKRSLLYTLCKIGELETRNIQSDIRN